jgi:hypothetical protein
MEGMKFPEIEFNPECPDIMPAISAEKAFDMLTYIMYCDEFPCNDAIRHVFGMSNPLASPFVLRAWKRIFNCRVVTAKQIVEAVRKNELEKIFKESCNKLAAVSNDAYEKTQLHMACSINFGRFNLRDPTHEESIKAFKNYIDDMVDYLVLGNFQPVRPKKPREEILSEMKALISQFEDYINCVPLELLCMANRALKTAKESISCEYETS